MKFPALVNCTSIDWFQPWPSDALLSVGQKYLAEVDLGGDAARLGVETFMPFSFTSVGAAAIKFRAQERREVHTTPKSFLELLKLYAKDSEDCKKACGGTIECALKCTPKANKCDYVTCPVKKTLR